MKIEGLGGRVVIRKWTRVLELADSLDITVRGAAGGVPHYEHDLVAVPDPLDVRADAQFRFATARRRRRALSPVRLTLAEREAEGG
jgi:hypothetical protein